MLMSQFPLHVAGSARLKERRDSYVDVKFLIRYCRKCSVERRKNFLCWCHNDCLTLQEVRDLQLAVQMRDDHLAECQRQSDIDQQQIDDLERQLLMQVCSCSSLHQHSKLSK